MPCPARPARARWHLIDLQLDSGRALSDREDHLTADPVVLGVGVVAQIGLGVDEIRREGVAPRARSQPGAGLSEDELAAASV